MDEIKKTKDYSIFKISQNNRNISEEQVARMVKSIQTLNLLHLCPILVNDRYEIVDGQHRFCAAKVLGLEVYYKVDDKLSLEATILMNANQTAWKASDFVECYAKAGSVDYLSLIELSKKYKLNYNAILSFLRKAGIKTVRTLNSGAFKFPSKEEIERFEAMMDRANAVLAEMRKFRGDIFLEKNNKKILESLIMFLGRDDVKDIVFLRKLEESAENLHRCMDISSYYRMFVRIYNHREKNKIPELAELKGALEEQMAF